MRYRIKTIGIYKPKTNSIFKYYRVQIKLICWWTFNGYYETVHEAIQSLRLSKGTTSFEFDL
jgi:hypothetical protein